jgi:hypothetical protein
MAIEGDVLHPKTFLYLGFEGVVRWKSPASEMFLFQSAKHVKVRRVKSEPYCGVQGPEMASGAGRLLL